MSDSINAIKGFADIFPPESEIFTHMENMARKVFSQFGYKELRTPLLERTELFSRGIGTETDVVQKEMYTFPDRKGRSLTLRPEATAGVLRAFIESGRHEAVNKFFTIGPMFRYERPQKGRMRQFHQINCECLGPSEPYADAELIVMAMRFLQELGLQNLSLELNSLGCPICRPAYREVLSQWLNSLDPEVFCEDCRRRISTNPLRVLDCKVPSCKEHTEQAPKILDHLCPECAEHFAVVRRLLERENIPYTINHRLVRGLDYYTRTTFEVSSSNIGSQTAVAGGGRYDGLLSQLGGNDMPGLGFACGMERLALLLPRNEEIFVARPDFIIAVLDNAARDVAFALAQELRNAGLCGEMTFAARSVKSAMRQAGKSQARRAFLLGENELAQNTVVIKNMDDGEQITVPLNTAVQQALN